MASGPEAKFHNAINNRLPKEIYREKMHNPYRGGTPDFYYEGNTDILWVEYKYWQSVPKRIVVQDIVSPLQWRWLLRSHMNGRKVAVIVGYKDGGYVFDIDHIAITGEQFKRDLISKADLAFWIQEQVHNENKLGDNQ